MSAHVCVLGDSHLASVYSAFWVAAGAYVTRCAVEGEGSFLNGLPVPEPGLAALLASAAGEGHYWESQEEGFSCDAVHLAQDVRVLADGRRDEEHLRTIRDALERHHRRARSLVLVSSQLATGTTRRWARAMGRPDTSWVYVPENVVLGEAVTYALDAPVLYGADDDPAGERLHCLLGERPALHRVGTLDEAEFFKQALNCLLAVATASSAELYELGEHLGVSSDRIFAALRRDCRLARLPIRPGPPISGPTLLRELRWGLDQLEEWDGAGPSILAMAAQHNAERTQRLGALLDASIRPGDSVLFLGVGYKAEASYPHSSLGRHLLSRALGRARTVYAHHPGCDGPEPAGVRWLASLDDLDEHLDLTVRICGHWPGEDRVLAGIPTFDLALARTSG